MDTLVLPASGRRRRRYTGQFKAQIIEACQQPGMSIAAIALANQLNANLVRRWVREASIGEVDVGLLRAEDSTASTLSCDAGHSAFVPVHVSTPDPAPAESIHFELRRHTTVLNITWPVTQAAACAVWLKDLLR